jgi:hypothetical protein
LLPFARSPLEADVSLAAASGLIWKPVYLYGFMNENDVFQRKIIDSIDS